MEGIHCKLSFNNGQFRRFLFTGSTFLELRNQVKQLLSLTADDFQLCYLDNEGDMIIISSDEELNCARAFTKDVLRIFVNPPAKSGSCGVPPSFCAPTTGSVPLSTVPSSLGIGEEDNNSMMDDGTKPGGCPYGGGYGGHHGYYRQHGAWHGQHPRGGRGGCRRGGRYGPDGPLGGKPHWKECKKEKISVKIAVLQSLLDTEGEMSENTKSKLEKKLGKLQKKLEKFEGMKDSSSPGDCEKRERRHHHHDGHHGGRGGGGNPQARELWMKIKSKKAELRNAEREGKDEAIIKELVGELNALKLEKASLYQ